MAYLIKGSAKDLFTSFRYPELNFDTFITPTAKSPSAIQKDIGRFHFWGNSKQGESFQNTWLDPEKTASEYYLQGNMCADNICLGFGPIITEPLLLPGETIAHAQIIQPKIKTLSLGYEDEEGLPCGLFIRYREDSPDKWIIVHSKNSNLPPDQSEIMVLTSFDPKSYFKENMPIAAAPMTAQNEFVNAMGDKGLKNFVSSIINSEEKINPHADCINLFTHFLPLGSKANNVDELIKTFNEDLPKILDSEPLAILQKYDQQPWPQQVMDCLDKKSQLYNLISAYKFKGDKIFDSTQLSILLFLDAHGLNDKQNILNDTLFCSNLRIVLLPENYQFLATVLRDDHRAEAMRFLMKTDQFRTFFKEFIAASEKTGISVKLTSLAAEPWNFPKDEFYHAVLCSLLCKKPDISVNKLLTLREQLKANPLLTEVIDPLQLADFIAETGLKEFQFREQAQRFLMETPKTKTIFNQFVNAKKEVWNNLTKLSEESWAYPKDNFQHDVICKVLCRLPDISINDLLALRISLSSEQLLGEIFDPFDLADFLTEGGVEELKFRLFKVQKYFDVLLVNYKDAAAWRQKPLTPRLLSSLAKQYIVNPNDEFLKELSFCSEPEQIEASYILLEQRVHLDLFKSYITDPNFVNFIKTLKNLGLEKTLGDLFKKNNLLAFNRIAQLNTSHEKQAMLILIAQNQLNPEEYEKLAASFDDYANLAELIVNAHKKGFNAKELKLFAFDPMMYRAANLLVHNRVDFNFKHLTPFVCQTLLFIAEMSLTGKNKYSIKHYLGQALSASLAFFNGDQFNPVTYNTDCLLDTEQVLVKELGSFLDNQMELFRIADELKIPESKLLVKNKDIVQELFWALQLVLEKKIHAQAEMICTAFVALPIDAKVNAKLTETAIDALVICANENINSIGFEHFLQNHKLARVIKTAAAHQLPILPLLNLDESILAALNKLSRCAPDNKAAFELAMSKEDKGHDFRLMLMLVPKSSVESLLEFIQNGGLNYRRKAKAVKDFESDLINPPNQLDESFELVRRLRELDLGDEVIDFMVKNDDLSRHFYRAVRKIEAESEKIRARLEKDHPEKFKVLKSPEKDYRRDLYRALYEGLQPVDSQSQRIEKTTSLKLQIKAAENKIIEELQIDSDEVARWIAAIFTNMATIALTVITLGVAGYLHARHYKKTGDFFFFASTKSEEDYKTLNNETLEETLEVMSKIN